VNTELLCTFTSQEEVDNILEEIQSVYTVAFDKIFVLNNKNDDSELFCTYNIDLDANQEEILSQTISIHRKKKTNTLYTINALNELIKDLNNGILDKTYQVPWEEYENSLLVTNNGDFRQIHTELYDIVKIDD